MKEYTYFPAQKISSSQKTKEWFKKCADSAENLVLLQNTGELSLKKKMQVWIDLYDDIIDENELMEVLNPMGFNSDDFPAKIKNFPITVSKVDLLVGEEVKRRFDWNVISKSEDAHSTYNKLLKDSILQLAVESASAGLEEDEIEEKLKDIIKYYTYDYKDLHEVTAARLLQYLWREQELKEKFVDGYLQALLTGREIYRIDSFGGKPHVARCDSRSVFALKKGSSPYIEDSDIIVEVTYEPVGKVIDEFHKYLTPSEVDRLEAGYEKSRGSDNGVLGYQASPVIYSNLDLGGGIQDINDYDNITYTQGLPFDLQGNVRVVRVRWLGRRKVGTLTYFDEEGNEQQRLVSEFYKPVKEQGEWVKWFWINEALEATKLAEDIYVKCQIRDVQMRHFDNPSMCFLGYVGTDFGRSLMGRMEPYQYLYNIYMYRLELALAKYKGAIYEMDISKKPDDWDVEQWLYYAEMLGYLIVDSFNEGNKGAATGRLAGTFNTTGKVLDATVGNYIQQMISMLQYIEQEVGKIAGVTEQREGQISNRETVGGIERAVTQSSHITEKWFYTHEQTKRRVMQALLDTSKQIYSTSKSVKLNYILDDMSRVFLEFNGEDFASTEYDIFVSNSAEDQEIRELIKGLSQAAVQNGASLTLPIKILKSSSVADMTKKLEIDEQERIQREEEARQQQLESNERIAQMNNEQLQAERDLAYYKIDTDYQKALDIEMLRQAGKANEDGTIDMEKLELQRDKLLKDVQLRNRQLAETERHNKAVEDIARSRPNPRNITKR